MDAARAASHLHRPRGRQVNPKEAVNRRHRGHRHLPDSSPPWIPSWRCSGEKWYSIRESFARAFSFSRFQRPGMRSSYSAWETQPPRCYFLFLYEIHNSCCADLCRISATKYFLVIFICAFLQYFFFFLHIIYFIIYKWKRYIKTLNVYFVI